MNTPMDPIFYASTSHAFLVLAVGTFVGGVALLMAVAFMRLVMKVSDILAAERAGVPTEEGSIVSPDFAASQTGAVAAWTAPEMPAVYLSDFTDAERARLQVLQPHWVSRRDTAEVE